MFLARVNLAMAIQVLSLWAKFTAEMWMLYISQDRLYHTNVTNKTQNLQGIPCSLPLVKSLWPSDSTSSKILSSVLRNVLNYLNKSLSSMNTSCCNALILYYLWLLLLLSTFTAILSQQPLWHSIDSNLRDRVHKSYFLCSRFKYWV